MTYKAVLFDLDGTLLDTLEDIGSSANRVLLNRGFSTYALSAYRQFVGEGARTLITRALPAEHRNENFINACLKGLGSKKFKACCFIQQA